jgi:hypothetical protein
MTNIFAPALFLIRRLSLAINVTLIGALFALTLCLFGTVAQDIPAVLSWLPAVAALYFLGAFYIYIKSSMESIGDTVERIASGDLTVRLSPCHTIRSIGSESSFVIGCTDEPGLIRDCQTGAD